LFDDRYRFLNVFGCGFPLRLVSGESLVPKGKSMVECHANICGILFCEHLVEGVAKAHDGRCVEAFGVDTRVVDECVIRPINECIGVQEKQFVHILVYYSCKITKKMEQIGIYSVFL